MLVQLGNHAAHRAPEDGAPSVTTIVIPDADHEGLGGYTHAPGLSVEDFREHHHDAILNRGGITRLPDHEAILAIVNAWPEHAHERPAWVKVTPDVHHDVFKIGEDGRHVLDAKGASVIDEQLTKRLHKERKATATDLEAFLRTFHRLENEMPGDVEDRYHTRFGPPGHAGPALPKIDALFTNDGRVQQAQNYGGGQVGSTGQATASSASTLTNSGATWGTNQWAGCRVYAAASASAMVWANVISNTGTVLTVDRWYSPATPGGVAGGTPSATGAYLIADGGVLSAWFVALTTTNITPGAADHALAGEYTAAGGGCVRKIAPYSMTSGTAPGSITLSPVYTANGSDTLPSTFYALAAFCSMVVANTTLAMKFESSLTAAQTLAAVADQLTCVDTQTFS